VDWKPVVDCDWLLKIMMIVSYHAPDVDNRRATVAVEKLWQR
jgi:hypothetical protein